MDYEDYLPGTGISPAYEKVNLASIKANKQNGLTGSETIGGAHDSLKG